MAKENKRLFQAKKSQIAIKEARHLGRVLKAMKGSMRQGVKKVTITENGVACECNAPSSMERALFMEGMRRFSQTNGESPMNPEVTKAMGFWGQKPAAENSQGENSMF